MCAVIVMAHGKNGTIFGKDMGKVSIQDDILKRFSNESCPKMVGKPKLFIFQSCRGDTKDEGFYHTPAPGSPNNAADGSVCSVGKYSSVLNDSFEAYSTICDYAAWRNKEKGSYFIQILCDVFKEHAHELEIQRLFKLVVSKMKNQQVGEYILTPPQFINNVDKDLFFKPQRDEDEDIGKITSKTALMTCGLVKKGSCNLM